MLCVVCSVHWVFYSVLFSTVLYWAALYCAVLLWCSASAVVCSLYKFSSAKNSSQLALFCALCSVLCSQLPPYRSVSVCSTYYVQLLPSVEYQIHRMNASQAGRHTYTEAEGRQSQSAAAAAAQTQALTMYLYLCIFCIGVCICVSFIRYVRSVRFVGLFALCAQSRGNSTAQRTHTIKTHTRTRTHVRVYLAWPRFHCMRSWTKILLFALYEHTAAAAARASSWTVAGHM